MNLDTLVQHSGRYSRAVAVATDPSLRPERVRGKLRMTRWGVSLHEDFGEGHTEGGADDAGDGEVGGFGAPGVAGFE